MTTLGFRLPANRLDQQLPRRRPALHRLPDAGRLGRCVPIFKAMDAEAAALIALRRLGNREMALNAQDTDEILPSGWFDSTWELSQGLDIAEGMPSDLPLDGWLQFYLAA